MSNIKKVLVVGGLISLMLAIFVGCGDAPAEGDEDKETIGLVVSTLNNPFFVSLEEGVEEEAEDMGYDLTVLDSQDDSSQELSNVEDLVQQEVSLILINPVDSEAVESAVTIANDADIPVVTLDRSSEGGEVVSHVASDNVAGGEMAGDFIVDELDNEGKVVELEGVPGASATRDRGEGFNNAIDDSDLEVIASQTANFNRQEGLSVMENILQAEEEIDAVFAHNDEMALGALRAIEDSGRDIMVVGFDATDDAREAVSEGSMAATVAQQPELIGSMGVEVSSDFLTDEEIDEYIPVELELVTE
ncbi:ribose ABC transporter substrate-binding protein RbsB [Natranaerobius trueperi]|uniref:D-ribose ABC transporter substrate-binding protein RbsB n=1 Tax=Natranaerobius trueperi TaxID=759412 RepID=A0A226BVL6_9FIRM|nr:ribose ABC transporter substrate-binding protein RbsB [Natranaerobius trueperi]OWZ83033.1 D-ribose ABC transporter substrate-binding protein RbsB [Natranaerobius trueperi]